MALQKTPISVPLGGGIDTKTSDALIMPAHLSRLENCVFTRSGELQKRPGFAPLARPASEGKALAVFDDELLVAGDGAILAYSEARAAWYGKGSLRSPSVRASSIYADQGDQTFPDCATLNGVTLYAYESTTGGLYAMAVDEATGTRFATPTLIDANGSRPVVVACGSHLLVFYLYTSSPTVKGIKVSRISTSAPTSFSSAAVVVATSAFGYGEPYFAIKPFNGSLVLFYVDNGNNLVLAYVTEAGTIGGLANGLPDPLTVATTRTGIGALNVAVVGTTEIFPLWAESNQLWAGAYGPGFVELRTSAVAGAAQAHNILNVTGAASPLGGLLTYFEVAPASGDPAYNSVVRRCRIPANNGSVTGVGTVARSVGLATEAFLQDDVPLVGVVYDSAIQATLFVVDNTGLVYAKALAARAGGLTGWPRLSQVQPVGADRWISAVCSKQPEQAEPGNVVDTPKTFSKVALDFSAERYRSSQLGRNQHLCGGVVHGYDGNRLFEAGFHVFPEQPKAISGMEFDLVVTSKSDTVQTVYITPPADITGPNGVKSGARIRPGSYIVLGRQTGSGTSPISDIYLWFRVDGVGSAPFPGTAGAQASCDILSTDDQATVAFKIKGALSVRSNTTVVSTLTATIPDGTNQVKVTDIDPAGDAHRSEKITPYPVLDTQFGIQTIWVYTSTPTAKVVQIVPCAGQYIQSGQWFAISSSYINGTTITTTQRICFYFVVDGVAPSVVPAPNDCDHVSAISINSTDTALQVHTAVKNAINAFTVSSVVIFTAAANATDPFIRVEPVAAASGALYTDVADPINYNVGGSLSSTLSTHGSVREYLALYAWTDSQGQLHRSAPSLPLQMYTGATQSDSASPTSLTRATNTLSVSTLRVTRRPGASISIELYRTTADGTSHYRVATQANDATVDSVTFVDTVSDIDSLSAQPLYTDGGEVENIAPPPSSFVGLHGDRLWVIDENDLLWFSKPLASGYAVAWSDLFTMPVTRGAGSPVAVVTLDEKGIIFKTDSILAFAGDGPDNTGGGNPFTTPQVISSDVGCVSPESLVLTPDGWMFQSKKGIYLLDRSLRVTYLGAPVQEFNAQDITSATLMPSVSQVRFTTSAGQSLFFDYVMQQWGSNTYVAQHALLWGDSYVRLGADGLVRQETPGAFVEESGAVQMLARTSWLKLADVQGFGRVYKALLLGRYISKHRLNVEIEYDYDETTRETLSFDAGASLGGSLYGDGATYGSDDPYGGSVEPAVEQLDIRPAIQKCEAIRFTIYDDPSGEGESLALVHLQLIVGVKGPAYRLGPSRTPGS